jgi:2-polyprenyl-3-methyl-5-hydroxy-6-metoxy-1,4-benzoquinol methylase
MTQVQPTRIADTPDRFEFGKNWQSFLKTLDDDRIEQAMTSLQRMLGRESLAGQRFLDLGSGSGLFSLAAYRLGANVVSMDFDPQSVACTQELRRRESASADRWVVRQGSVLDASLMSELGTHDLVYSWGVLHHTGNMRQAIELASHRVKPGGQFFIAIYNDQGGGSRRWLRIKRIYNRLPSWLRPIWVGIIASFYELKFAAARLARLQNPLPFASWSLKRKDRGMSAWHDWVDWIGGLPFEVATPEAVILPLVREGFQLTNLSTVGNGWGCNQYVFRKSEHRDFDLQKQEPS